MAISDELLKILACPKCKGSLDVWQGDDDGLLCRACSLVYPVRDDIPVMLIDEAIPLDTLEGAER